MEAQSPGVLTERDCCGLQGTSPAASLKRERLQNRNTILRRTGFLEGSQGAAFLGARFLPRRVGFSKLFILSEREGGCHILSVGMSEKAWINLTVPPNRRMRDMQRGNT